VGPGHGRGQVEGDEEAAEEDLEVVLQDVDVVDGGAPFHRNANLVPLPPTRNDVGRRFRVGDVVGAAAEE